MTYLAHNADRILKISILSSVSLLYIYMLLIPGSQGYQISIYRDIHITFWLLLTIFILLLLIYCFLRNNATFLLVPSILASLIVILLPRLVGYYRFLTGDSFIHVGRVRTLIETGEVPDENRYPLIHILSAILKEILGIQVESLPILITISITIVMLLGAFILSRRLSNDLIQSKFIYWLFFTFILSSSYYNYAPWAQSHKLFIIFIIFLLLLSLDSSRSPVLMLLFLTASILFHPLTGLILILILGLVYLDQNLQPNMSKDIPHVTVLFLYTLVLFTLWTTFSSSFRPVIRRYSAQYLGYSIGSSPGTGGSNTNTFFGGITEKIAEASPQVVDLLIVFVARFGEVFFIIGLSLILLGSNLMGRRDISGTYRRLIILPLLSLWGLGTIALFTPLPFGFGRFYGAAFIFALIVIGCEFSTFRTSNSTRKQTVTVALVIFLILLVPLSIGTSYNSTWEKRPNSQVLKSELATAEWIYSYGQSNRMYSLGMSIRRFTAYLHGINSFSYDYRPPPHFVWNTPPSKILDTTPVYMIISPPARITYPTFYPSYKQRWDYTPADFKSLQTRSDLNRIYDAGNGTIYNHS